MDTIYYKTIQWSHCDLLLMCSEVGASALYFVADRNTNDILEKYKSTYHLTPLKNQHSQLLNTLNAYLSGEQVEFNGPLDPVRGTPFQKKVWNSVKQIPYGETRSYGQIAASINQPKASRAVGTANGANPLPIIVPCHRVIQTNGNLGGYGGGITIKDALLRMEQSVL